MLILIKYGVGLLLLLLLLLFLYISHFEYFLEPTYNMYTNS